MDIDTTIEIGFYEIYVIFLNMMIQINSILFAKKGIAPTYNTEPRNIRKEICYLYYHYECLEDVCNYILKAYCKSDRFKKKVDVKKEFINALKETYKAMNFEINSSFVPFEDTIEQ